MNIIQLGQSGRDVAVWQRFLDQTGHAPETPMLAACPVTARDMSLAST